MKTFNILIKSIALIGIVSVISSCSKMLDTKPITEYSNQNYWSEKPHAQAALAGAYRLLQSALGPEFAYYGEGRTDNLLLYRETNAIPINLAKNSIDPSMDLADWGQFYAVIKQCNEVLLNVPKMAEKGLFDPAAEDYKNIIGEALGLRALCYFYMVRLWGDVPLITEPVVEANQNIFNARADTSAVLAQVKADLDNARLLVPPTHADNNRFRARIMRGAIDAMLTDYHMWRHDYENALVTSARVTAVAGYSLAKLYDPLIDYTTSANAPLLFNTDYVNMFTKGFSTESIFEIDFAYTEGTYSNLTSPYRRPNAFFKSSVKMENRYDGADLRALVAIDEDSFVAKFFERTGFNSSTMNDKSIIMYRLADIILLRAEALNELDRRPEALILVNQIRARAGATPVLAATFNALSKKAATDYILEERARELCFEGKRWFDLLRTGRALEVMNPINGIINPGNLLWPVALDALRSNPKLVQNEFYK